MQANQTSVIWTVVISAILLGMLGMYGISQFPEPAETQSVDVPTAAEIAALIEVQLVDVPTAAEIAALVSVPTTPAGDTVVVPSLDNEKLDRVCELTEGCEFYEGSSNKLRELDNGDAENDFFDAMVDLTGIDEDYLEVQSRDDIDLIDYQIRAYSEEDKDDDNWEIKTFIKVRYYDTDEANSFNHYDAEYAYIVVTSVLDEGDYDSLSIEEVNRNFEF